MTERPDDAAIDEIEDELEAEEAEPDELEDEAVQPLEDEAVPPLEDEAVPPLGAEPAAAAAAGAAVPRRRGATPPSVQRAPTQSELAVRVTDNASRLFVIATVAVFVAILGFGLLAGNGGLLTATPAPPSAAPSVSVEPSSSGSAEPSASAEPSPEASASPA